MLKKNRLSILLVLLMAFFAIESSYAQQKYTAKGTVVDELNQPVIGATVMEKGTTNAVTTDIDGAFSINVASAQSTIVISYLGYLSVEIAANSSELGTNIVMKEDVNKIEDVVVIGYGTVRKKDMTGAVNTVRASEMRGAVSSPQDLIQGKVPGVHIVQGDGRPGSGAQIRVRGMASLQASNDPLIVIDGMPVSNDAAAGMGNPLNTLNANDIESFTVLKDASATAIYGSRASNGVIIITTKRGSGGKFNLSYDGSYSLSVNTKRIPTMTPAEYRQFMDEYQPVGTPMGDNVHQIMGQASTDWQDLIFRNAFVTDHNISANGNATDNLPYRVSLGYTGEEGTIETSKFDRYTLDMSVSPKLLDKHLQISINAKGVYNKNHNADGGVINAAAFFDPTQDTHFRNADGSIDYNRANGWWNWYTAEGRPNYLAFQNPMSILYDRNDVNDVYRLLGNVQFDYKLHWLPQLRFNLNLGLDQSFTNGKNGVNPGSIQSLHDSDPRSTGIGTYSDYINKRTNKLLEFYTAYANDSGKHHYDIMGGYSWQRFYTENDSERYINVSNELFENYPSYRTENVQISFFGRANYSYDNRYLFTVSFRSDASSRFSPDNRWGYFPAAAFAWNISNEGFMKDNATISNLKLRLSWGVTGQQDLGLNDYPYMSRYHLATDPFNHYFLGDGFYSPLKPIEYDENIKWETTTTYNAGLDYGFLNGRLNGSLDYYWRRTDDLLNRISIPMGSNFSNVLTTNIGSMENTGLELAIGAIPVMTGDWTVNVGFNATWQKTEITKLTMTDSSSDQVLVGGISGGQGNRVQVHNVGYAPYTFYTYKQVYDQNGKPIQNALVDVDGNGIITAADRVITNKKPSPDFFFGLNAKVNFRDWDFGFNSHASFGNWMYNDFYGSNSSPASSSFAQGHLKNYSTVINKTGFREGSNNEQYLSDMFLENASFFRMDDITLGYTFKEIGKTKVNIRTAFCVQNVFVITKYSGLDPEGWGIDNNIWPRPRIYSLRLNVKF